MEFGKALVLVLVCISHCVSGEEKLRRHSEDSRIPGKYIVVLKTDVNVNSFTRSFETLRAPSEVKMIHKYEHALNGFAAHLSDGALNDLIESDHVEYIEEDSVSHVQAAPWGLDRIDQRDLPLYWGSTPNYKGHGEDSHIYVVDTGILRSHAEFSDRIGNHWDFEDGDANDCHGHGTHVAGTAAGSTYGVANKATIHPVRVYNCQGTAETGTHLIDAMEWIITNKASGERNVASLSLGHDHSPAINTAAKNMYDAGIVVVVSAGNQGSDACNYSPGSLAEAITVGATNYNDERWEDSNYGSCVDIFAPGVGIKSAYINHDYDAEIGCSNGCAFWSGTSMACPHVSGAAAILLGLDSSLTPAQVAEKLLSDATPDKVSDPQGSPNKLLYIPSGTVRETRHGEVEPMPTGAYERGPGLLQAIMGGEDK